MTSPIASTDEFTLTPRILWGYHYYKSNAYPDLKEWNRAYLNRVRSVGYEIDDFCLTLNPPGRYVPFKELDKRWKKGDVDLFSMYERLERRLEDFDVLFNATGINLHPEFVERLPVFTVFECFDDPESSEYLSRHVAASYDLCFVGNVAEVDTYRGWGARAEWTVRGLMPGLYDPTFTEEDLFGRSRDIDLFMMIDGKSPHRKDRLDHLARSFPDAHFYGRGWKRGILPFERQLEFLHRAKVGPNIHNSTGPVNLRTIYLPANGVLQICDNKSHLGTLFEVGQEVVGFETVDECIDLCRYYVDRDEERRKIAMAGYRRAMRDYTEEAVFGRIVRLIKEHMVTVEPRETSTDITSRQQRKIRRKEMLTNAKRAVAAPHKTAALLAKKALRSFK